MLAKPKEHLKAIELRKQGKSYSEILNILPVSQSTLSLWLRRVSLSSAQKEHLALRKLNGQIKGASSRRKTRETLQQLILSKASSEIETITKDNLFLMGAIAYWCEGSKQKEHNISQATIFSNSDPFLLRLFVKWLKEICNIEDDRIKYTLYIHKNSNIYGAKKYWSKTLNIAADGFGNPVLKKHNILTKRRNIGNNYYGLIRITVKRSTDLNRKISGWIKGVSDQM